MDYLTLFLTIVVLIFGIMTVIQTLEIHKYINKKEYNVDRSNILILSIILLSIILIVPYLFTLPLFKPYNYQDTGAIGDTINGLTAPFITGIAAILVFLTFKEQVRANRIQIQNLTKVDNQNKEQSFESNFFSFIQNHHQLIEGLTFDFKEEESIVNQVTGTIEVVEKIETRTGLSCILKFKNNLILSINKNQLKGDQIIKEYNILYNKSSSFLSHLLRNLYLFVKFIDEKDLIVSSPLLIDDGENEILNEEKSGKNVQSDLEPELKRYDYIKILRAQLSSDLIIILALNAFTNQGENFKFYIRKYRLLKNINLEQLPDSLSEFLIINYPHIAFEWKKIKPQ